jgi:hypothetical protein
MKALETTYSSHVLLLFILQSSVAVTPPQDISSWLILYATSVGVSLSFLPPGSCAMGLTNSFLRQEKERKEHVKESLRVDHHWPMEEVEGWGIYT